MSANLDPSGVHSRLSRVFDESEKHAIQRQLIRILESPSFCSTKRSQLLLRHIVSVALDGKTEQLKERCIGVDVFGRSPDYDTNTDAVVRISANDVRKRLAQYEMSADPGEEVRITLPPGSYLPEFQQSTPVTSPTPPTLPQRRFGAGSILNRKVLVITGIVLVALVVLAVTPLLRKSPREQFWQPVLKSSGPVVITIGQSTVYLLSERVHQLYDSDNNKETETAPHVAKYGEASIPGRDVIPVPDIYTGLADAVALGRLMEMFGQFGKPVKVRFGEETSFSDLRDAPMVLLGFNNRWNREVARDFRFSFERTNQIKVMKDATPPGRTWSIELDPGGHSQIDYGLICRVLNGSTGHFIVQAGGLGTYGTRAAAEFLTSNLYWGRLVEDLPGDWPSRNLQVVIRVKVVRNTPGVPEIVAIHSW